MPCARASRQTFSRTSHLAPHTSHMARLRPRWLGFAIAFYTWTFRGGDLGVHPRCSDTSSAFEKESRSAAMFLLAYGRSTCAELASRADTKVSHDDTVSWKKSRWAAWLPKLVVTAVVLVRTSQLVGRLPRRCAASRGRPRLAGWLTA